MVRLELEGRSALITGAAGGIGTAVSALFAAEGADVTLVDRAPDGVRATADTVARAAPTAGVQVVAADVTVEDQVAAAVTSAVSRFGRLDLVVSCAGVSGPVGTGLEQLERADWDRVFAVNVTGSYLLLKHALPVLRRAPHPAVVLLASDSAVVGAPGMVVYCASKAAVVQLARATSVEVPDVRINAVCPSVVDTPMSRGDLGLGDGFADVDYPVQTADEVAAQVAWLCSPRSRPVNGTSVLADFGFTARSGFPA